MSARSASVLLVAVGAPTHRGATLPTPAPGERADDLAWTFAVLVFTAVMVGAVAAMVACY